MILNTCFQRMRRQSGIKKRRCAQFWVFDPIYIYRISRIIEIIPNYFYWENSFFSIIALAAIAANGNGNICCCCCQLESERNPRGSDWPE